MTPSDLFWRSLAPGSSGRTRLGILMRIMTNTRSTRWPDFSIEASYLDPNNKKGFWDGELGLIADQINKLCPDFWDDYQMRGTAQPPDLWQQKNLISKAVRDCFNFGGAPRHVKPGRSR